MSNVIIVGFKVEGSTDGRFLASIIQRTFEEVAFECDSEIDVHSILPIDVSGESYVRSVQLSAVEAHGNGVMALCIHCDSDAATDNHVFQHKIEPAIKAVSEMDCVRCDNIVPIVPVQETESWMLADLDLLRNEIGTDKSIVELGLSKRPEDTASPKEVIEQAMRIAFEDLPARRKRLTIAHLYQPLGQKISLSKLRLIPSYEKFRNHVRQAYIKLNYLVPLA